MYVCFCSSDPLSRLQLEYDANTPEEAGALNLAWCFLNIGLIDQIPCRYVRVNARSRSLDRDRVLFGVSCLR